MALAADPASHTLYSGSTDGTIRTWDLTLFLCKRTLPGTSDVLSLGLAATVLVAGNTGM
jgi:WD40 repeat protein